jgi:hypothetical protein
VEARNIGDDFPRHGLSYDRDNFDDASLVLQRAHTAIVAGTASLMGAQEPPLPPLGDCHLQRQGFHLDDGIQSCFCVRSSSRSDVWSSSRSKRLALHYV